MTPVNRPAQLWHTVIDCNNLDAQKDFWTWLLDLVVLVDLGPSAVILGPTGGPHQLCLQFVDDPPPQHKNRVHLDVVTHNLETVREEVQQRGGRLLAGPNSWDLPDSEPVHWYVMHDPEGNEFCLIEARPDLQMLG